jgi:hypothetical protein
MQTTCRPSALRSVSYLRGRTQKFVRKRQGARHRTSSAACKPARLPPPKQASRSAIVRTFWTTVACFGPRCHLVSRRRLPPLPGMVSMTYLAPT